MKKIKEKENFSKFKTWYLKLPIPYWIRFSAFFACISTLREAVTKITCTQNII